MRTEIELQQHYRKLHDEAVAQSQSAQPGIQKEMEPRPATDDPDYRGSGKLQNQVCLVTGGDSGIGQAAAIAFAKEGADVAVNFLDQETPDARLTREKVESHGRRCLPLPGNLREASVCKDIVDRTLEVFGRLDVAVNNAAYQMGQEELEDIDDEQLLRTFETNVYPAFRVTRAALPHMKDGARLIFTTSVVAYRGSGHLIDYASTKGALLALMRSLAKSLAPRHIRVNGIAPGPIWTPFIPPAFPPETSEEFGHGVPLGRRGQPAEVAPAFVYLASTDSSYVTGQVMHVNGGTIVGA